MTQIGQKLPEQFDQLREHERAEVLSELLRRLALAPHDLPGNDDLISTADQLFTEFDRREGQ
jgi:hypothetical protein